MLLRWRRWTYQLHPQSATSPDKLKYTYWQPSSTETAINLLSTSKECPIYNKRRYKQERNQARKMSMWTSTNYFINLNLRALRQLCTRTSHRILWIQDYDKLIDSGLGINIIKSSAIAKSVCVDEQNTTTIRGITATNLAIRGTTHYSSIRTEF